MTEQIVIKLNKKKFEPILQKIQNIENGMSSSYSELVGKCVFFNYLYLFEKVVALDEKTIQEFVLSQKGIERDSGLLVFLRKYTKFLNEKY